MKGSNYVLPFTRVRHRTESCPYQKGKQPILQVRHKGEIICPKSTTSQWKAAFDFRNPVLSTPLYSWTKGLDNGLVVSLSSIAELCLFCDLMDCSPPDSSVHGISQARPLEFVAISFSRGSSPTQSSNPALLSLLHWQADSLPLSHQGSSDNGLSFC